MRYITNLRNLEKTARDGLILKLLVFLLLYFDPAPLFSENNSPVTTYPAADHCVYAQEPWWSGWRSGGIFMVSAALLFYILHQRRISAIVNRNRLLEKQAAEQTAALNREKEQLRRNEEKYRELVEGVDEVFYRMSLPLNEYEYISPSVEKMGLGYIFGQKV